MLTPSAPRRGRYSKNGCLQCKARRIKCDEGKPCCWQCSRFKKQCLYLREETESENVASSHRVQAQRNLTGYTSHERLGQNIREREKGSRPINGEGLAYSKPHETAESSDFSRETSEHTEDPVANTSLVEFATSTMGAELSITRLNWDDTNENVSTLAFLERSYRRDQRSLDVINNYDLNLLALDLDSIVNDLREVGQNGRHHEHSRKGNGTYEEHQESEESEDSDANFGLEGYRSTRSNHVGCHTEKSRNLPFDYIPVSCNNETLYFEEFYNCVTTIIQPLQSYDKVHGYYCATRDILLQVASKEPFVLSAILSQGARTSYEKHGLKGDKEASHSYLVKCLRILEPALLLSMEGNELAIQKIEGVFLTILILQSANGSTKNPEWGTHLREATKFLLKYSASSNEGLISVSNVMVFCKHWFISLEISAALNSNRGGALRKEWEMDLIWSTSDHERKILEETGIVRPDGFNLLVGVHHSCLDPLGSLIKLLNRLRNDDTTCNTLEVIELLSKFNNQLKTKFVFLEGTRRVENLRGTKLPEGSLLDFINIPSGKLCVSWMDISHQAYVLASMVILLRKGLRFTPLNAHVQCLNKVLLNLVSFLLDCHELSTSSKTSILLLQWPMLVAGLNCTRDDERLIAMKYFRNIASIEKNTSTFALRKLNKVWNQSNLEGKADCVDNSDAGIDATLY